jgi:hypothetical protein
LLTTNNISNKRLLKTNIIKLNQLLVSNDFVVVSCAGFRCGMLRRIWKSCATTAIKDENKKSPPTDTDGSKLKS